MKRRKILNTAALATTTAATLAACSRSTTSPGVQTGLESGE